jgi:hypothetical protein
MGPRSQENLAEHTDNPRKIKRVLAAAIAPAPSMLPERSFPVTLSA